MAYKPTKKYYAHFGIYFIFLYDKDLNKLKDLIFLKGGEYERIEDCVYIGFDKLEDKVIIDKIIISVFNWTMIRYRFRSIDGEWLDLV